MIQAAVESLRSLLPEITCSKEQQPCLASTLLSEDLCIHFIDRKWLNAPPIKYIPCIYWLAGYTFWKWKKMANVGNYARASTYSSKDLVEGRLDPLTDSQTFYHAPVWKHFELSFPLTHQYGTYIL